MFRWKEKKLLIGFALFLILTITIGIIGIFQIQSLTFIIQELGQKYLVRERSILEMKINNTLYAMGVRNFVFWRTSKYLGTVSFAKRVKLMDKYFFQLKDSLKVYSSTIVSQQEKEWVRTLKVSFRELENIGKKLVEIVDRNVEDERMSKLMISFENKYYQIDNFLSDVLSKNNLKDIENQLKLAQVRKNTSVLILMISLVSSIVLGIGITYIVYKSLKEEREHRELLVRRMIRVEEQERKNLSRQMHDQLSQDLSALKIYLELIEKEMNQNQEQKEKIEKSKKILSSLIEKSHNISQLLRPPQLDELGLVESIKVLISEYKEITDCNYTYSKPEQELHLPPEYSLAFYRIAQEALTNIAKHSQAKNVIVFLQKKGDLVSLCIKDDGVGFNYQEYLKKPRRRKEDRFGLGLQGLRERIELLGGNFSIDTAPNRGTKIKVELIVSK